LIINRSFLINKVKIYFEVKILYYNKSNQQQLYFINIILFKWSKNKLKNQLNNQPKLLPLKSNKQKQKLLQRLNLWKNSSHMKSMSWEKLNLSPKRKTKPLLLLNLISSKLLRQSTASKILIQKISQQPTSFQKMASFIWNWISQKFHNITQ